jgi:hypothetical protein
MIELIFGIIISAGFMLMLAGVLSDRNKGTHVVCWKFPNSQVVHRSKPMTKDNARKLVVEKNTGYNDCVYWYEEASEDE